MLPALTLRVLILDDNRDCADSLAMLVRLWGYEPVVAYGGESALELASIHRPHVVILDLGLPQQSGLEVARRLRQRPELEATALLAVSGFNDDQTRRRAAECGIEAFMVKPVEPATLEALLGQIASQALVGTIPLGKKTKKLPRTPKPDAVAEKAERKADR